MHFMFSKRIFSLFSHFTLVLCFRFIAFDGISSHEYVCECCLCPYVETVSLSRMCSMFSIECFTPSGRSFTFHIITDTIFRWRSLVSLLLPKLIRCYCIHANPLFPSPVSSYVCMSRTCSLDVCVCVRCTNAYSACT